MSDKSGAGVSGSGKKYETKLTGQGAAALAACILDGVKLEITHIAAGDGGGTFCEPLPEQTALVREVWRGKVLACEKNPLSPNMLDIKGVIPSDAGGFVVRELGVFDKDGTLIGVCNTPEMEKETLSSGAGGKLDLIMHLIVTDANAVQVFVKPSLDTISLEDALKLIDDRLNNIEDMVTARGGGHMEMAESLGTGPYHMELDEEEDFCAARSCRVTVGTSAAGWTEEDCDYLCDGSADEAELNAAIAALLTLGGGKLMILAGTYSLTGDIRVADDHGGAYVEAEDYKSVWLCGEGGGTVLSGPYTIQHEKCRLRISSLHLEDVKIKCMSQYIDYSEFTMHDCSVTASGGIVVWENAAAAEVRNCRFSVNDQYTAGERLIFLVLSGGKIRIQDNIIDAGQNGEYAPSENTHGINIGASHRVGGEGDSLVTGNLVLGCGTGIAGGGGYISGNTIVHTGTGILMQDSCTIVWNTILNIQETGIKETGSAVGPVAGNYISNQYFLQKPEGTTGVDIYCETGSNVLQNYIDDMSVGILARSARLQAPFRCAAILSGNIIAAGKSGIQLAASTDTLNGAAVTKQSHSLLVLGNQIIAGTTSIEISSVFKKCLIAQNMCPDAPIVNHGTENTVTGNVTP